MARRTKEDALATRERLLDTAELLFQRQGVSRTSLNDIAAAAGLTRGAIYWHFADKADLFNAMIERVCLPLEDKPFETAGGDDPLDEVRRHVIEVFRVTARDERVRRVFEIATHKVEYVDELVAVRERHLQARATHLAQVQRQLSAARRLGRLRPGVSVKAGALTLHALVDGMIQGWMLDPGAFDLLHMGREAVDLVLEGMRAGSGVRARRAKPRARPRATT